MNTTKVQAQAPKAKEPKAKAAAKPRVKKSSVAVNTVWGVGRRKSAVARVWIRKGTGSLVINGKDYSVYFDTEITRSAATLPLAVVPRAASYDVEVNVEGGGLWAQADAVKLGISRALLKTDENLKPVLREHGLLTVDSRVKERKKYGQKAARRRFQFVKR